MCCSSLDIFGFPKTRVPFLYFKKDLIYKKNIKHSTHLIKIFRPITISSSSRKIILSIPTFFSQNHFFLKNIGFKYKKLLQLYHSPSVYQWNHTQTRIFDLFLLLLFWIEYCHYVYIEHVFITINSKICSFYRVDMFKAYGFFSNFKHFKYFHSTNRCSNNGYFEFDFSMLIIECYKNLSLKGEKIYSTVREENKSKIKQKTLKKFHIMHYIILHHCFSELNAPYIFILEIDLSGTPRVQ
jgi:hypothetical protein